MRKNILVIAFFLLGIPSFAHAAEVDYRCVNNNEIITAFKSAGLDVSRRECEFLRTYPFDETVLIRPGEEYSFEYFDGNIRISLESRGEYQSYVLIDPNGKEIPFETRSFIDFTNLEDGTYVLQSDKTNKYASVFSYQEYVYVFPKTAMYTLVNASEVASIKEESSTSIIVVKSLEPPQLEMSEEEPQSISDENMYSTGFGDEFQHVAYSSGPYDIVGYNTFTDFEGKTQKEIWISSEVFSQDHDEFAHVVDSILSIDKSQSRVDTRYSINPAIATWSYVLKEQIKNAIPALFILGIVIVGLILYRNKTKKNGISFRFSIGKTRRARFFQILLIIGVFIGVFGFIVAQSILALEQSGVFVRTLINRFHGIDIGGGEYCRKCFFLDTASGFLSGGVFLFLFSWVYIDIDKVKEIISLSRKEMANKLQSTPALLVTIQRLYIGLYFGLIGSFVFGLSFQIQLFFALFILLQSIIFIPSKNNTTISFSITIGALGIAIISLLVLVYSMANVRYRFFDGAFQATLEESTSSHARGGIVFPFDLKDENIRLYATSPVVSKPIQSTLKISLQGTGEISLFSKDIFSDTFERRLDSLLADFQKRVQGEYFDIWERNGEDSNPSYTALYVDPDQLEYGYVSDQFSRSDYFQGDQSISYISSTDTYPLGVSFQKVRFYIYAVDSLDVSFDFVDHNQKFGSDEITIVSYDPFGQVFDYRIVNDDRGIIGEQTAIDNVRMQSNTDEFKNGIYTIELSVPTDSYDVEISSISSSSPYIALEGEIVLFSGSMVEGNTPDIIVNKHQEDLFSRPCYEIANEKQCFHHSNSYFIDDVRGKKITAFGTSLIIGDQYSLFVPIGAKNFEVFETIWQDEIDEKTTTVIMPSGVSISSNSDEIVTFDVVTNYEGDSQSFKTPWSLSLEEKEKYDGVLTISNIELNLEKK